MNTRIIEAIEEPFGELTIPIRKKHKFLRTDIEFLGNSKVLLLMKYYIEESITSFIKSIDAKVSSPTKNGLQNILILHMVFTIWFGFIVDQK